MLAQDALAGRGYELGQRKLEIAPRDALERGREQEHDEPEAAAE